MSKETKVLIYCIIKYYRNDFMFREYRNLEDIEKSEPLEERLVLEDRVKQPDDIYKMMNVVY